jgi:hypothetical protein
VERGIIDRDLGSFMQCLSIALLLGLGASETLQITGAVLLVLAYLVDVIWTFRHSRRVESEVELRPLVLDSTRSDPPAFTPWELDSYAVLAGVPALAGGWWRS